jgi:pimeloyl-ACP methyl ester carboxylesterase
MRLRRLVMLMVLASGMFLGCGEDAGVFPRDAAPADVARDGAASDAAGAACTPILASAPDGGVAAGSLAFSNCQLLSGNGSPRLGPCAYTRDYYLACPDPTGDSIAKAECATACLPADWSVPNGEQTSVFVKRHSAAQQPASAQLWLLGGGPGEPGVDFEEWAYYLGKLAPTLDIYLPDHRGTGRSALATCTDYGWPLTAETAASCAASIPHLDGLTVTGAARDLAALIDAAWAPGQPVFVYGLDYGTYWAQRYLQIRPEQPTGVILDSTFPPGFDMAGQDQQIDAKAHALLEACKSDATCAAKLGPDPVAAATAAIALVESGQCVPAVGDIRAFLGLFVSGLYFEQMLMPAAIYRILRCNFADLEWFAKVESYLQSRLGTGPTDGASDVTHLNIVFSELWPSHPSEAALRAQETSLIADSGFLPMLASLADAWPQFPTDAYLGGWPSSPAAMLILQGTMDGVTPFGDLVKPRYVGANQYFVEIPNASHVVVASSPIADPGVAGCGLQVVLGFLANPSQPPDTSCIAALAPLDYGSPPAKWLATLGIADLWENP